MWKWNVLLRFCRKVHTESAKKWLEKLQEENVPVLVCLTFADKLYAEHMTEDGKHPSKESMKHELGVEQCVSVSRLNSVRLFNYLYLVQLLHLLSLGNPREIRNLPCSHSEVLYVQPRS